jgi:FkbM family methyltransferase
MRVWIGKQLAKLARNKGYFKGRDRLRDLLLYTLFREGDCVDFNSPFGFKMKLYPADLPQGLLFVCGEYEPETTRRFLELLRPGDTLIDAGAHAGYFSLLAATLVGANGRVIAIEPMAELLPQNIQLNSFPHVEVLPCALHQSEGQCNLYEGEQGNTGMQSLLPGRKVITLTKTIPLDAFCDEQGPIRLIKLDVEGAEYAALLGGQKLIEKHRPHLLLEYSPLLLQAFGHAPEALLDLLREWDYQYEVLNDFGASGQMQIHAFPASPNMYQ